jgi:hypothetical protein
MNSQDESQLAQFKPAEIYCVVPSDFIFCELVYSQWEYQLKIISSKCVQIETFYGNDIVNSRT